MSNAAKSIKSTSPTPPAATRQMQAGPGLLAAVQGAAGAEAGGALLILGGRKGDGRDTVTDAVWTLRP